MTNVKKKRQEEMETEWMAGWWLFWVRWSEIASLKAWCLALDEDRVGVGWPEQNERRAWAKLYKTVQPWEGV